MADQRGWAPAGHIRPLVILLSIALLSGFLVVVDPSRASAAGTILFRNTFADRTVDGTGTVTVPSPTGGTNAACLSASGNTTTSPLLSCTTSTDVQGSGKLRLTRATGSQVGGVYGATSFPTSGGLDVTFNSYQYGGSGADGVGFILAAVDPTNPVAPSAIGPGGGSLGYSPNGGTSGVPNAYLGVGLDVYGNFTSTGWQGSGCASNATFSASGAGTVAVRGPGNGTVGYCGLTTSYTGSASSKVTLRSSTRAASVVPVQVLVNPTTSAYTSDTGVTVASGSYVVAFTPVGGSARTLTGTLPTVPTSLYTSSSYLNANGYPKQLAFGFVGSTGAVTDFHEISDVEVNTFTSVAQLAVAATAYTATTPAAGDPVNYVVTPSVRSGTDVSKAISVTQTLPSGVAPLAAYGSGWTCASPVGQTVTCTTTGTSFANGSTLPAITVVAVVTGSSVTASTVQSGSTSAVSSENAGPASTTPTLGTLPAAPSGVSLSPAAGSTAGGYPVSISGTNLANATAVELGTTAEQAAGKPVVLVPCSGTVTTGCFTVSGSTLVVSSWPARSTTGAVGVRVVTLGQQAAATFGYNAKPAAPTAPTATAGVGSATVTWTAPDAAGSTITGYVLTPYLNGVAQTPVSYDASTTTRTLTGLTVGGSYTFTVVAVNANGSSATSPPSTAVVPYTLPGAPAISGATAGDASAVLTWTAPASDGSSAVTGYVVTPYVGGVAQTPVTFSGTSTTRTVSGLTPGTAYTFTVAAVNAAGTGPASAPSAAVTPNINPSLTFAAPPAGEVGVAYSRQLAVNDGTAPFVWSVSSGALPAGLSLSSTGLLSGTPTAAGSVTFTVQVADASGQSATRQVTLVVAARPAVTFTPAAGEVAVAYSQQPTVSGGTGPFSWSLTAGSLPGGLTVDAATGLVSGTPTTAGTFSATLTAADAFAQTASRTVSIVVAAQPTFVFTGPPSAQAGVDYTTSLTVSGGTSPLTWAVAAGSLPPGLTLNTATGVVSGTPTTPGTFPFTVSVTDGFDQSTTRAVTLTVGAGPIVITKTASASTTTAGGTVSYTITVANTGTTTFTGVNVSDPLAGVLDDATYDGDASASLGSTTYASGTLGWTGTLAGGASATITYSVTVADPVTGNSVLSNTVSSTTTGSNCPSGGTDARCTATVTVSALRITKTANVSTTTPGGSVRFTVVVTNAGGTAYVGASFTDPLSDVLDDAVYDGNATATAGTLSSTSSSLTWTGNLAVGATATITYTVSVANPDPGNRSLTGTVVSPTAGSVCPSGNAATSCTATVTVLVPALSVVDTAGVSSTTPGSVVRHTVTISNTGQTPYAGATVAVALAGALDDATYGADAAASSGSVGYADGVLTWTGDLAVGSVATVSFSVTVANPDRGDRTLTTVASSSAAGSTCPDGSANTSCTSRVTVLVPQLTLTRTSDVSSTTPGSVVHYTVRVSNTGQTGYTGATFSDPLSRVLDDATYDGNAAATSGTVSFASSTLSWTGDLAVGATATVTYSVTVRDPDPGDRSLDGTLVSPTPFSTCPSGGTDARCSSSVPVLVPALSLAVGTDVTSTVPGGAVRQTFSATNTGQTTYTGVAVVLDLSGSLDDATYGNDFAVTSGTLSRDNGVLTWTLDLAPGASASGSGTLTVRNPDPGDRSLVSGIGSSAAGSTCPLSSGSAACRSTVPVLLPGLTITKTADRATVRPGQQVGWTITVVNDGQTVQNAAGLTDSLATVLTDATYDGNASATSGTVTYANGALSWSGILAVGASARITYSATVRNPDPGDKQLDNTVVSASPGSNCTSGSTDTRCRSLVSVLVPQLSLVTTASSATTVPGATVTYTVKASNSGAVAYTGATFTDALPGVLDDATYANDASTTSGTVSVSGGTLTWTGDLAIGASVTVTYSVTVNAANTGDNLVTDAVSSTAEGSTCTSGSTDTRCRATVPVARLVIQRNAQETSATPGSTIHIPATYTNVGQVPYTNISVTHPRADSADDVYPTGPDTATSGSLVRTDDAIVWTGDIPVGGSVTVSIVRVVRDPDPGNHVATATIYSSAPGNNCPPGSTDPRCTFRIPILEPGLTVTTTASATTVVPGGTVGYTVTIANSGQTPYLGATVSDDLTGVLDDAVYNGNATATGGTLGYTSPTLTWTGDLAVGATVTISYSTTATSPGTGDKLMTSTVSSAAKGSSCPSGATASGCRVTVTVLTPALTLTKTSDVSSATLGSVVTSTITVVNSGQVDYPSASLTDSLAGVLDDATYSTPATANRGSVSYASGVISWSGALAVGQSATITYQVTVKNPDPGDRTMTDTLRSDTTGSNCPSGTTDARCTSTVTVTNATTVTFTKTASAAYATPGSVLTYTIKVRNNAVAGLGVAMSLTDPLSDVLDDATYNGDASATTGTVSVSGGVLSWSTSLLAINSTTTITYSVTANRAVTGNQLLADTLTSGALLASNNCSAGSGDPRCATSVPVARLQIAQSYDASSTTPGSVVQLTATFTNTGRYPFAGITVTSPTAGSLDDADPLGNQTASSGTLVLSATAITWTGQIAVGQTVTIRGGLRVKNPDNGDRFITGTLVTDAPGSNCGPSATDPLCTATIPVLLPALTITKTASASSVVPGNTVGYTIRVVNSGQTPYTGAVVADDLGATLDDATFDANATASSGTLGYRDPVLTWTGNLAVGASATITYTTTVRDPDPGDKTMTSTVSSSAVGSTCPPGGSTSGCLVTVGVLTPGLSFSATTSQASAVPGDSVTSTVVVTDSGQTSYAAASFTVPLAGLLDDATVGSASATSGSVTRTGSALTWTGALDPGQSATITWTATVKNPVTGDFRLSSTVVSSLPGSTCPTGSTNRGCATSVPVSGLRIVNTADVATVTPTGVVRFSGTITNSGQVPYVAISVTDSFVGALDDAVYNGDATASSGSIATVPGSGRLVWTGDVPVGATVAITGSVTVLDPDPGDKLVSTRVTTAAAGSNCPVGGSEPACTAEVTVLVPALTIGTASDASTTTPGGVVTTTLTFANTGQTDIVGARVGSGLAAVLDDADVVSGPTASRGTVVLDGTALRWSGDVPRGQSAVVTYAVRVKDPDPGDRVLLSSVTSDTLGSTCTNPGSSGCTTSVTVLVPRITTAIAADRTTTVPGATVAYTVSIANPGQTPATGAAVTVLLAGVLDDAGYDGNAAASRGTVVRVGSALTWTGDLAVGDTASVTFSVTVATPPGGDRSLVALLDSPTAGAGCRNGVGDVACASTVSVLIPGLAVSTSAAPATTTPGSTVQVTTTLTNTGQTGYPAVTVTSSLADVLDDATLVGQVSASNGTASYVAPNLTWTGPVPLGATVTLTYTVRVKAADALGDHRLRATVVTDAAGSTCPSAGASSACTATADVLVPRLEVTTGTDKTSVTPGGTVTYTTVIANTGETSQTNVSVSTSLAGVVTVGAYARDARAVGGGVVTYDAPVLTWTGSLPAGASATLTFSVTANDPASGDRQLDTVVSSDAAGSTCPSGATRDACATHVPVLVPALQITKTADASTVVAGSPVQYTVTVVNTGQTPYAPATWRDDLTGVLDDATYGGGATATSGTLDYTNGTLVWTGALGVGATATITYSVLTTYPATGDHVLRGAVVSPSPGASCVAGTTQARCQSDVTVLVPALSITKAASATSVVAGAKVGYTITATNTGEADYPAATFVDALGGVLDDASSDQDATATSGSVSSSEGTLTWFGALAKGATVVVTYTVTVNARDTGDGRLLNTVASPTVGSTCPATATPAACTVLTTIEPSVLTISDLPGSFRLAGLPGDTVEGDAAVTMTVTTNSVDGYAVTVAPTQDRLRASGTNDTIPIGRLAVRPGPGDPWSPLAVGRAVTVHTQDRPSAPGGDAISNDYRVQIPFVDSAEYDTQLEYVVTAQ